MVRASAPNMRLKAAQGLYAFRESLFLLPVLMSAAGLLTAVVASSVDTRFPGLGQVPGLLDMSSNAATWLLSTVAGAMITTAGVVLSLTVVSLQLASNQFSPRVMRTFVRDRMSQTVIGLLMATFCFCVLTLPRLDPDPAAAAPAVSLTLAVAFTLLTVIAIIAHLDHLAKRLQVGHVLRGITEEALRALKPVVHTPVDAVPADEVPAAPRGAESFLADRSGWVSAVDIDSLLAAAPAGTTIRLETRVGAYVHVSEPLLTVWPVPPAASSGQLSRTIAVTDSRTMQQDVDFAIRQLCDIGLRALSSAINDPTTAVEVILQLGTVLRHLLLEPAVAPAIRDAQGRTLVRPWDLTHEEYVAHAFDQLRQVAAAQPAVATALARVIRMLLEHVAVEGQQQVVAPLERQLTSLVEAVHAAGWAGMDVERFDAVALGVDPADHTTRPDAPGQVVGSV